MARRHWRPDLHPRYPRGKKEGGRFRKKVGARAGHALDELLGHHPGPDREPSPPKLSRVRAGWYASADGRWGVIGDGADVYVSKHEAEGGRSGGGVNTGLNTSAEWSVTFDRQGRLREDANAGEILDWADSLAEGKKLMARLIKSGRYDEHPGPVEELVDLRASSLKLNNVEVNHHTRTLSMYAGGNVYEYELGPRFETEHKGVSIRVERERPDGSNWISSEAALGIVSSAEKRIDEMDPAARRRMGDFTVALGPNPADGAFAEMFHMPGFTSGAATAIANGDMTFWNGGRRFEIPRDLFDHESGHLVQWRLDSKWLDAQRADANHQAVMFKGEMPEDYRHAMSGRKVRLGAFAEPGVTPYGTSAWQEDFAESYMMLRDDDRGELLRGSIGPPLDVASGKDTDTVPRYKFEELFPNRARLIRERLAQLDTLASSPYNSPIGPPEDGAVGGVRDDLDAPNRGGRVGRQLPVSIDHDRLGVGPVRVRDAHRRDGIAPRRRRSSYDELYGSHVLDQRRRERPPAVGEPRSGFDEIYDRPGVAGVDTTVVPGLFPPGIWTPESPLAYQAAKPTSLYDDGHIFWKGLVNRETGETRLWTVTSWGAPHHNPMADELGWKSWDGVVGQGTGKDARLERSDGPIGEQTGAILEVARTSRELREWEQVLTPRPFSLHGAPRDWQAPALYPGPDASIFRVPRDEYVQFPYDADPKDPHGFDAYHQRRHEWDTEMVRALSIGEIDQQAAEALGYNSSGHDNRESIMEGGVGVGGWQPLPPKLYHATTARSAVMRDGLKTRAELAQENGLGLGGGDDGTISFTTDRDLAVSIAETLREARKVARGEITPEQLLAAAERGDRADRPFLRNLVGGGPSWQPGMDYPRELQGTLEGVQIERGFGKSPPTMPGDWKPYGPTSTMGVGGPEYQPLWQHPLSEDEIADRRFELYKKFLFWRAQAGGPDDPLFFLSDPHGLGQIPEDEIAALEFRPRPNGHGYPLAGMAEWRTGSGAAVEVVGPADASSFPGPDSEEVPSGFPPGIWTPDDSLVYFPERPWIETRGRARPAAFWKMLYYPDTDQHFMWFSESNGSPHHVEMTYALGLDDRAGTGIDVAGIGSEWKPDDGYDAEEIRSYAQYQAEQLRSLAENDPYNMPEGWLASDVAEMTDDELASELYDDLVSRIQRAVRGHIRDMDDAVAMATEIAAGPDSEELRELPGLHAAWRRQAIEGVLNRVSSGSVQVSEDEWGNAIFQPYGPGLATRHKGVAIFAEKEEGVIGASDGVQARLDHGKQLVDRLDEIEQPRLKSLALFAQKNVNDTPQGEVGGVTTPSEGDMMLFPSGLRGRFADHTFAHETGHLFQPTTDEEWYDFVNLYRTAAMEDTKYAAKLPLGYKAKYGQGLGTGPLAQDGVDAGVPTGTTPYASTHPGEDFADAYAFWRTGIIDPDGLEIPFSAAFPYRSAFVEFIREEAAEAGKQGTPGGVDDQLPKPYRLVPRNRQPGGVGVGHDLLPAARQGDFLRDVHAPDGIDRFEVGISPKSPNTPALEDVEAVERYFHSPRYLHFVNELERTAEEKGLNVHQEASVGKWQRTVEPARYLEYEGTPEQLLAWLGPIAREHNQDAIITFRAATAGEDLHHTITGVVSPLAAMQALEEAGFEAGTYRQGDGAIEVFDFGGEKIAELANLADSLGALHSFRRGAVRFYERDRDYGEEDAGSEDRGGARRAPQFAGDRGRSRDHNGDRGRQARGGLLPGELAHAIVETIERHFSHHWDVEPRDWHGRWALSNGPGVVAIADDSLDSLLDDVQEQIDEWERTFGARVDAAHDTLLRLETWARVFAHSTSARLRESAERVYVRSKAVRTAEDTEPGLLSDLALNVRDLAGEVLHNSHEIAELLAWAAQNAPALPAWIEVLDRNFAEPRSDPR